MVQCSAKAKSTGRRCEHHAIRGGSVCRSHGGSAPQVRSKANERIEAMVFPALSRLNALIGDVEHDKLGAESEAVALAAARDILDRAGYTATQKLAVSGDLTVRSPVDLELDVLAERLRKESEHVVE